MSQARDIPIAGRVAPPNLRLVDLIVFPALLGLLNGLLRLAP